MSITNTPGIHGARDNAGSIWDGEESVEFTCKMPGNAVRLSDVWKELESLRDDILDGVDIRGAIYGIHERLDKGHFETDDIPCGFEGTVEGKREGDVVIITCPDCGVETIQYD